MTNLIGIAGRAGAGKTTMAKLIQAISVKRFHIYPLADAVREEIADALAPWMPWTKEEFVAYMKDPETKAIFRLLMQWWGTDFRRNLCGEDYWLKKLWRKLRVLDTGAIIDDVRFMNEVDWIKEHGGAMVYVYRPGGPAMPEEHARHVSEQSLSHEMPVWDHVLVNDGSLEDFEDRVRDWFTDWAGGHGLRVRELEYV